MLPKIKIKRLTGGEFVAFISDVERLFNRIPHATLTPFLTPLSDEMPQLDAAYQLERSNLLTASIKAADARRDEALKGIKKTAQGHLHHFDPAVKEAATFVIRSMDNYAKRMDRLGYPEETAAVASLIGDWTNQPHLTAAITTLNFGAWQAELAAANDLFSDFYLDRVEDESTKNVIPLSKLRKTVTPLYLTLERKLVAYHELEPATYGALLAALAELVDKYNAYAA